MLVKIHDFTGREAIINTRMIINIEGFYSFPGQKDKFEWVSGASIPPENSKIIHMSGGAGICAEYLITEVEYERLWSFFDPDRL